MESIYIKILRHWSGFNEYQGCLLQILTLVVAYHVIHIHRKFDHLLGAQYSVSNKLQLAAA